MGRFLDVLDRRVFVVQAHRVFQRIAAIEADLFSDGSSINHFPWRNTHALIATDLNIIRAHALSARF